MYKIRKRQIRLSTHMLPLHPFISLSSRVVEFSTQVPHISSIKIPHHESQYTLYIAFAVGTYTLYIHHPSMENTPEMDQISSKLESKPPMRVSPSFRLHSKSLNIVRLRRIFDAFDGNGDGQISVPELGQALQRLGLPIPLPELESTVRGFFSPGSDGLDFDAFVGLHGSIGDKLLGVSDTSEGVVTEEDEQDLREAFGVFDEDGDGFISASELQGVLRRLGLAEANDVENMIHSVDANRDGLVDFFEFKQMMTEAITVKGF